MGRRSKERAIAKKARQLLSKFEDPTQRAHYADLFAAKARDLRADAPTHRTRGRVSAALHITT